MAIGLGLSTSAWASLTDNIAVDPEAMAMGNAVTADPPGINSIHFNPAGLVGMETSKMDALMGASIRVRTSFNSAKDMDIGGWTKDPLDGTSSGTVKQRMYLPIIGLTKWKLPAAIVPGIGFTYHEPGSRFTFGTSNYVAMAYTVDHTDPGDPAAYDGKMVDLQRLVYLSPAVAFKVSDKLKIGMSVPIAYVAMAMNTDMRFPNPFLAQIGTIQKSLCANGPNVIDELTAGLCAGGQEGWLNPFKKAASFSMDITAPMDPTVNVGFLWEPKDWFALGGVYQSGAATILHGTYEFKAEPMLPAFVKGMYSSLMGPIVAAITGMPPYIPPVQKGNMVTTIPMPYHVQFGFKFKPSRYFQFNTDISYANWSKWDSLTLKFDQDIKLLNMAHLFGVPNSTQLTLPLGMKDVVNYSFGVKSQITEKFALRFGYEPRKSSEPQNVLSLLAPLPDTKLKSVGFTYKLSNGGQIDFGASYMYGKYNVPARTDCNLNCDHFTNVIYNPYAAMDVKGDIAIRYAGIKYTKPL
ncbi:outer membrane protein transport protein [Burkholderiaceae bacterium DAT-1]|nr:outer membrane protein transport protein [Burkholderiaceae bacterium DAT-1]